MEGTSCVDDGGVMWISDCGLWIVDVALSPRIASIQKMM
jgi:hypothetical protein